MRALNKKNLFLHHTKCTLNISRKIGYRNNLKLIEVKIFLIGKFTNLPVEVVGQEKPTYLQKVVRATWYQMREMFHNKTGEKL